MQTRSVGRGGARSVTLEIADEVTSAIEELAARTGQDFGSVAGELLAEAIKLRLHPGIVLAVTPTGRHANIAGTDTRVSAVIGRYNHLDREWERLREAFPHLTADQLQAAIRYEQAYQDEI